MVASFFRECSLCGKGADLVQRWFKYDNGEQALLPVCPACAGLHARLLGGK
jgi:hypothetical protein